MRRIVLRCPVVWLGLVAAGCQTPAARPAACGSDANRAALLVSQGLGDTAVGAAAHPGRGAFVLAVEPASYVRSWFAGLLRKRLLLPLQGPPGPVCPGEPAVIRDRQAACPAELCFFVDGGEALAALDRVIDGARHRIDVVMYIWGNDPVGWHVARKLAARAGPDRRVRVLVDGGGNLIQGEPEGATAREANAAVCWLAGQPHVELIRGRIPLFRFDHRKLVIADGQVAWSGGRNFYRSAFESDHDLSYTLAGPLAAELDAGFERYWREQGGRPAGAVPSPPPLAQPNAAAHLVRTRPTTNELAETLYRAVRQSRHHVYAQSPYFADNRLIALLARARRRGADVRVVTTLDTRSDLFDRANRVTANRLLAAGVRVYLFPGVTHAKAMAVDGTWAYTGTGNFDNLSFRHNRELGVVITGGPAVGMIEEQLFLPDFNPEWELTEPLPVSPLDYLAELVAGTLG